MFALGGTICLEAESFKLFIVSHSAPVGPGIGTVIETIMRLAKSISICANSSGVGRGGVVSANIAYKIAAVKPPAITATITITTGSGRAIRNLMISNY